ncbi:MAG: GntR family transcriptional regulator [Betaproteobacteria bacterium]|nr:GntR family transcriptional regulator [Betaproteobacteria bacterium]
MRHSGSALSTVKPAQESPRHWQIANALRHEIETGKHAVGGRLPTEEQICKLFRASRYSTREALKVLAEEGLIVRRPRAGSTVIAATGQSQLIQRVSSIQEILNYAGATVRKTLSTGYVIADHELAYLLKCPLGSSWFRIQALRYLKDSPLPLCHTDFYVAPEYAGVVKHKKHESVMIVDQIAEMYGETADATQIDIYASQIGPAVAQNLDAKAGSPALNVIRRYSNAEGRMFEVTISVHPAQRHTYSFLLKREAPRKRKGPAVAEPVGGLPAAPARKTAKRR